MNIFTIILTQPLTNGLILFYKIFGQNIGLAIVFFSIALRFALLPLTKPYMESMKKMKEHAPQIEKLKRKHKDDKKKLMQAQAEFYKQKGINPGAGCLPYLLQIVVLFALFGVFSNVLSANGDLAARVNNLLYPPLKLAQDATVNTKFLYMDITKPDVIRLEGLPIPLPGPVLILAALTQVISAKIMSPHIEKQKKAAKKTKEVADDFQTAMQSSMVYTFPLITIFAGMNFASGLALYWVTFSLFQTIQQYKSSGWGGATPWVRRLQTLVKTP